MENGIKSALDVYSADKPLGQWARSIVGIGPVISAGLLAHLDVTKPTVGHLWRFAGLDPTSHWEKGERRPWNHSLKTLCWKIGESFVKTKNHERSSYGHPYDKRKAMEQRRNEDGELADQAEAKLKKYKIGKKTEAYKHYIQGRLPPAHIHARAARWTVKLFLSHYHAVGFYMAKGFLPPFPYPIVYMGEKHTNLLKPPNMAFVPGMEEKWDEKQRQLRNQSEGESISRE
jgi:hypothetical protein